MADQMLLSWLEWLEAECDHHPVLLILEDLHWGDTPSVNFVDAALRVLPEKPFMVLALARPEVDRRFPGVWKERSPQRINLAPLSPRTSQRMIEHVVGKIPEESVRWIVERSQGNPFYLEELLRVVRDGARWATTATCPTRCWAWCRRASISLARTPSWSCAQAASLARPSGPLGQGPG